MKLTNLILASSILFIGCTEQHILTQDIKHLKSQIDIAKQVKALTIERDRLQKELGSFQTRPETNVAPTNK